MLNILRENMRRFGTKNLNEQLRSDLQDVVLGGLTIEYAQVSSISAGRVRLLFRIQETNLDDKFKQGTGLCTISVYLKSPGQRASVAYDTIFCTSGDGGTGDTRDLDRETLILQKIGITNDGRTFEVSDNVKSLLPE